MAKKQQELKQQVVSAAESLRLTIEMANNGIIIRSKDYDDDITLATFEDDTDHSEEYRAIGETVFGWLNEVVIMEQGYGMVVTGFDLDISAKCVGRELTNKNRNYGK